MLKIKPVGWVAMLGALSCVWAVAARGAQVEDAALGFSLTVPDDFRPAPQVLQANRDFVYAFQRPAARVGDVGEMIIVERMRGRIGREPVDLRHMPAGFKGRMFTVGWQGFDIQATEVPEEAGGVSIVNYNVQVPLKREAIQLRVVGRGERKEQLLQLTNDLLASLRGESNWLASVAPRAVASSPAYLYVILAVCVAGVAGGLVLLWLVRRRSRRGTVLGLAVIVYAVSWGLGPGETREMRATVGGIRMLGFLGMGLGLYDLVRARRVEKRAGQVEVEGHAH